MQTEKVISRGRHPLNPVENDRVVHLPAGTEPPGNDHDVRRWAVLDGMARVDAQLIASGDRPAGLSHSVDVEWIETIPSACNREHLEGTSEVEYLDPIEHEDCHIARTGTRLLQAVRQGHLGARREPAAVRPRRRVSGLSRQRLPIPSELNSRGPFVGGGVCERPSGTNAFLRAGEPLPNGTDSCYPCRSAWRDGRSAVGEMSGAIPILRPSIQA